MHHDLKILDVFFEPVIMGEKKFEIRDNKDRGFQKGDTITLHEIINSHAATSYTGRKQNVEITYVSDYNQPENQVVFAFTLVGDGG